MMQESFPPSDDDGAGGVGFLSYGERSLSKRNLKQHQEQGSVSSDRPVTRSRSNLGRFDSRRWFAFSRRSIFIFSGFALLLLFVVTFYLESLMTSVFLKRSEKAWSRDAELKLRMTLMFAPQRMPRKFIEGNEVDRLHSENRFGFRKPRLALILRNMEQDSLSLFFITVMNNMKELGYAFESSRALRFKSDDVNAPQRLPLLKNRFYQDIFCEFGGMFAIANKIDIIHRRPSIGFQSFAS